MNNGLLGFSHNDGEAYFGAYRAPFIAMPGTGTVTFRHPFSTPVLAQAVLLCKGASGNYFPGDFSYVQDQGGNSTVNTTGMGFTRCDGARIAYTLGAAANQAIGNPNGTLVPINNANWNLSVSVLGIERLHTGCIARDRTVRRWRTAVQQYALGTLYSYPNLLNDPPAQIWSKLVCLSPELGFVPGDELDFGTCQSTATSGAFHAVRVNNRRIDLWISATANQSRIVSTAGAITAITPAKWGVYLEVLG